MDGYMNENRLTNLNSIKIDDYHAAFLRNERKAILRAGPEVKKSFRPALVSRMIFVQTSRHYKGLSNTLKPDVYRTYTGRIPDASHYSGAKNNYLIYHTRN